MPISKAFCALFEAAAAPSPQMHGQFSSRTTICSHRFLKLGAAVNSNVHHGKLALLGALLSPCLNAMGSSI